MRVVRVARLGDVSGEELALHPQLTVVRGAAGEVRSWLLDTIGRIDADAVVAAVGEVEASGVVMPLDAGSLDLLGIAGAVQGVVDASRLLARAGQDAPATPHAAEVEARAASGPGATEDPFDPVDSWFSEEPVGAGTAALSSPDPGDVEPSALVRPGDASGAAGREGAPDTPLQRRIVALRDRRHELERLAGSISRVDTSGLSAALTALDEAPKGVPVAEAAELADAWKDLRKDLQGLEVGTTAEEREALAAVARAQEAVARAEAVLDQPQLNDEQMARIEAAHAAHLEAADRVERRFGSGRARRQLAEAEAEEARLARLTDHVQMVVVTDRPEVAEWADAIGPDHASVVEVTG